MLLCFLHKYALNIFIISDSEIWYQFFSVNLKAKGHIWVSILVTIDLTERDQSSLQIILQRQFKIVSKGNYWDCMGELMVVEEGLTKSYHVYWYIFLLFSFLSKTRLDFTDIWLWLSLSTVVPTRVMKFLIKFRKLEVSWLRVVITDRKRRSEPAKPAMNICIFPNCTYSEQLLQLCITAENLHFQIVYTCVHDLPIIHFFQKLTVIIPTMLSLLMR